MTYKARQSDSQGHFEILSSGKWLATVTANGKFVRGKQPKHQSDVLDAIFDAKHGTKPHKGTVPDSLPLPVGKAKPTGVPQVLVSLTPNGGLKVELPGVSATRRVIELRAGEEGPTLRRILEAQLLGDVEIGLDGAPTAQQVLHWERHQDFPKEGCRFCMAEGRYLVQSSRSKARVIVNRSDCTVRVIPAKSKGKAGPVVIQARSAAELDL